jgi:sigma-E factor negative regulatory protein RseB
MLGNRRGLRFGQASWLGVLSLATAVALADPPRDWLARADRAVATRNYRGVFVHEHAGESETLRIVHRADATGVAERLVSMDGSGREFIRKGSQLFIYLPDRRTVLVEQNPAAGLWLHGLPSLDEAAANAYDIRELARVRISGRDARLIAIAPLDALRYGYRVWIDEATALPLKTQLRDGNGTVLEQIVFTDLTLPAHISDAELETTVDAHDFRWVQRGARTSEGGGMSASWQAGALPPGFRMTASARQVLPRGPVEHLVFSDGLASVSVFIERARSQIAVRNADAVARLGVSSAYSTALEGYRVTAVGEVPPDTVRAIALSIRTAGPTPSLVESAADARESAPEDGPTGALAVPAGHAIPDNALLGIGTGGAGLDASGRSAFGDSGSTWVPGAGARH